MKKSIGGVCVNKTIEWPKAVDRADKNKAHPTQGSDQADGGVSMRNCTWMFAAQEHCSERGGAAQEDSEVEGRVTKGKSPLQHN